MAVKEADGGAGLRLSVVMPVYNESGTVLEVINRVLSVPAVSELVVVDDGSSDGTAGILRSVEDPRVRVLFRRRNAGKGSAVRAGLAEAAGDIAVIQDADLEYDPADYPRLLEPIISGEADAVFGSRFLGEHSGFHPIYKFGNKMLTLFANILYGGVLTDMETCYKMFRLPFIRGIRLEADRFDFEPEITAKLLKGGAKIKEVPVSYRSRGFAEGKKITWRDGFAAVRALVRYRFRD